MTALAHPQGFLSPQVLVATSFANSSLTKHFDQIRKTQEAFAQVTKQFDQIQEQVGSFARANWKFVVKARLAALRGREGEYHASVSELTALVEILRSLLSWLLSISTRPKSPPASQLLDYETQQPNAPPVSSSDRCARPPQRRTYLRGCLKG